MTPPARSPRSAAAAVQLRIARSHVGLGDSSALRQSGDIAEAIEGHRTQQEAMPTARRCRGPGNPSIFARRLLGEASVGRMSASDMRESAFRRKITAVLPGYRSAHPGYALHPDRHRERQRSDPESKKGLDRFVAFAPRDDGESVPGYEPMGFARRA